MAIVRLISTVVMPMSIVCVASHRSLTVTVSLRAVMPSPPAGTGVAVRTSTSLEAVRAADLVLVLTSATDALIGSAQLKQGAVVLDDTQPRNTDPALAHERPDVLVIDGGVAAIPGIDVRGDIGLPRGLAYACLCETMLMAFSGHSENAVGQASHEHAVRMRDAARRFAHLGFGLADPLSFGRPTSWPAPVALAA